jgi:hypothetical protein
MAPPPSDTIPSSLLRARVIRRDAALLRAQSQALRQRIAEEYGRTRYLRAVSREVLRMTEANLRPPISARRLSTPLGSA